MATFRLFLIGSTLAIYALTVVAVTSHGPNWPAVAVGDLLALDWRSQFNTDFILYLVLFAGWIAWREGGTARGYALGALSIVMGGMFSFPYLLRASYLANGDPRGVLLGERGGGPSAA